MFQEELTGADFGLGDCSKDELINYLSARVVAMEEEIARQKTLINKVRREKTALNKELDDQD